MLLGSEISLLEVVPGLGRGKFFKTFIFASISFPMVSISFPTVSSITLPSEEICIFSETFGFRPIRQKGKI